MTADTLEIMVARIDERTRAMHDMLKTHLSEDVVIHEDHEKRIRGLERKVYMALGAIMLVTGGGAGAFAMFG